MRLSKTCAPALLLICTCRVASAAEPDLKAGAIETRLGETTYIQLTDTTPSGRPSATVRVQNPNRDYSVIRIVFDIASTGTKNRLRVRNGYDHAIYFAMGNACEKAIDSPPGQGQKFVYRLVGALPGEEMTMEVQDPKHTVIMCDFTVPVPSSDLDVAEVLRKLSPK